MVNIFLGLDLSLKDYRCTIMYFDKAVIGSKSKVFKFFHLSHDLFTLNSPVLGFR